MTEIDWKQLRKEEIGTIELLVATFRIDYPRGPDDMVIEVWQIGHGPGEGLSPFVGICNYKIWTPSIGNPYKSIQNSPTIEAAFNDAVRGIRIYDKEDYPYEFIFWVQGNRIIDGHGQAVRMEEAEERHRKYNEEHPRQ